jgi:c-di-GMP-binding flagellar brake protein YcgR
MQRRRFFRVRCGVTVTVAGADRDPILTEAVDLSVGGMLLARADSLRMGDRVRFGLTLGEGEILVGGGSIVRATPFGHRAVSFDALSGNQEQQLGHFVAEIQRRHAAVRAAPARGSRPRGR